MLLQSLMFFWSETCAIFIFSLPDIVRFIATMPDLLLDYPNWWRKFPRKNIFLSERPDLGLSLVDHNEVRLIEIYQDKMIV